MLRRGRWCQGEPSREVAEDVLVGEIPPGLGERENVAPQLLELEQRELAAEGIPDHITPRTTPTPAHPIELPPQIGVEAHGNRSVFHV